MILRKAEFGKLIIYLALIVILLVAIIFASSGPSIRESSTRALNFDPADIVGFSIEREGEGVNVSRLDGNWTVIGQDGSLLPGRPSRIEDFISVLDSMKLLRPAATRASETYGLGDGQGTRVVLKTDKGSEIEFRVGLAGSMGGEYYFEPPASSASAAVSVIDGSIGFYLSQTGNYWVDFRLWPQGIDLDEILRIGIYGLGRPDRVLLRDTDSSGNSIWLDENEQGLSEEEETQARMRRRNTVAALLGWEFQDFLDQEARLLEAEPGPGTGYIEVQASGNRSWIVLLEDRSEEEGLHASVSGSGIEARNGILPLWRIEQIYPRTSGE